MHPSGTNAVKQHQAMKNNSARLEETAGMDSGSAWTRYGSVVWRHIRAPLGIVVLILGAVGIVVPIVPGVPLLISGVALLGKDHPIVRACTTWVHRCRARLTVGRRPFWRGYLARD